MVESIKKLKKKCQKGSNEPFFTREFFRKISIYFTKLLLYTPISANNISILSGIIGLPSILFFSFGNYYYSIIGAILLFLWYILDHSDGEIARYRKNLSAKGSYIDEVFGILLSLAFVGISFGSYNKLHNLAFLLGFSTVISFGYYKTLLWKKHFLTKLKKRKNLKSKIKKNSFSTLIRKIYEIFGFIFHASTIVLVILFGSLLNILYLVLLFYGVTYPIYIFGVIIYQLYSGLEKTGSIDE